MSQGTRARGSTGPGGVLVTFAVREEARFFPSDRSALVKTLITGMGLRNARRALQQSLEFGVPNLVLTCGFAGGLRPGLAVGSVLFDAEPGTELAGTLSRLGARPAVFHNASRVATTAAEKQDIWKMTGADAVEMESGEIRRLCRERQIHSATIRVISDPADEDLPLDFNALMTEHFEINYWKLAWALTRSPARFPALLQLRRQTTLAARALGVFLEKLTRQERIPTR